MSQIPSQVACTIRVDIIGENATDFMERFLKKYDKYLIYEEVSDQVQKPHYQGIVWVPDNKAYVAIKSRFSTHFSDWTRGQKSMALVRKAQYEIYITKDKQLKWSRGYSDDEIKALEDKSYKKDSKLPVLTSFQKAYQYCKDHGLTTSSDGWQIAEMLIDYYRDNVKCEANDFQIKNMAKSIYTHCVFEKSKELNNPAVYANYRRQRAKEIMGLEWQY